KKQVSPPSNLLFLITTKICSIKLLSNRRKAVLAQIFPFTVNCANLSQYWANYGRSGNTAQYTACSASTFRLREVTLKMKPYLKSLHKWPSTCLSTQMKNASSRFHKPPQENIESYTTLKVVTR
ncbi:hypothetical protein K443DRAFT_612017, partial [Laccaria amethystina LaAM-08-1]